MDTSSIAKYIEKYQRDKKSMFVSSSFQTHSIPLLHILSIIDNSIPVVFLNTGFLFAETIEFRDQVVELLNLNVVDLKPDTPKIMQRTPDGKLLFTSDPDHCCYLNKTRPMESILMNHDVWINGVRADQSEVRKRFDIEQEAPHNTVRFHPMLDWNAKMIYEYRKKYNLPEHPLDSNGYLSIGCEPCTRKFDPDMMEREARWYGMNKTECGLHTELVK